MKKAHSPKPGLLVTFEGTEGAGKSTLIRAIETALENRGVARERFISTREPGGSAVAEKIRSVILSYAMNPWTELFLYEASRAQHLSETVMPALAAGKLVLCDRFTDSSLAYQGMARGLPWIAVKKANLLATQGLKPKLTVWLDVDPAVGLKRASDRNRFELEGLEFQKRVRKGFARISKEDPKRWLKILPGKKTPEALAEVVVKEIFARGFAG